MNGTSLILAMCIGIVSPFRVAENVVFEKVQDISVIRSSWIFSFFTDITAYEGYMERLEDNLKRTKQNLVQVIHECRGSCSLQFLTMYKAQMREVESLEDMYNAATQDLTDMKEIQTSRRTRVKRALVPIVGKALSFLFGTLTKKDLNKINKQIDLLGENQQQIIHVLNDTLSILNITTVEVKRNRHAIRSLNEQILELGRQLGREAMELRMAIKDLYGFMLTYLQLDLMITELRETIERGMFYIQDVKLSLDQLALGHIAPQSLTPRELKRILTEIQGKIPKHLSLPAAVDDIWYYYNTLTCITVARDDRFITLVNLPLIEVNSQFEVYQIHNIPMPCPRPDIRMTAQYQLESTTLAVNVERTDYLLLNEVDLNRCVNPSTKFCMLSSPQYKFSESDLCVVALFKQDRSAVAKSCKTTVQGNSQLPQAVYIPDGNWLIVSDKVHDFTIICLKDKKFQVKTKSPIDNIQIGPGCEAYSEQLTLPPFYHRESHYDSIQQNNSLLTLRVDATFDLWRPMGTILNDTDLTLNLDLPQLGPIDDMHIDELMDKLNRLKKPEPERETNFWDNVGYVIIPLVVLCILLTVLWPYVRKYVRISRGAMAMIRRTGTTSRAGNKNNGENCTSAESTQDQLTECHMLAEEEPSRRSGLTLELKDM